MRLPKGGHQNGGRGRRTSGLKQNRENASEGSLSRHTETLNYRPAAEEVTVILQGAINRIYLGSIPTIYSPGWGEMQTPSVTQPHAPGGKVNGLFLLSINQEGRGPAESTTWFLVRLSLCGQQEVTAVT